MLWAGFSGINAFWGPSPPFRDFVLERRGVARPHAFQNDPKQIAFERSGKLARDIDEIDPACAGRPRPEFCPRAREEFWPPVRSARPTFCLWPEFSPRAARARGPFARAKFRLRPKSCPLAATMLPAATICPRSQFACVRVQNFGRGRNLGRGVPFARAKFWL